MPSDLSHIHAVPATCPNLAGGAKVEESLGEAGGCSAAPDWIVLCVFASVLLMLRPALTLPP